MPPPQQPNQSDNSLSFLWILIGILVAGVGAWYAFQPQIVMFVLKLRLFEINIIDWFTPESFDQRVTEPVRQYIYYYAQNVSQVKLENLANLSELVGNYLKIPLGLLLGGLAFLAFQSNTTSQFQCKYDMLKLRDAERSNWPQITPIMKLDLVSEHCEKGNWSMAMTPMDFAKHHKLVRVLEKKEVRAKDEPPDVEIDAPNASQIFNMQMGKLFQGFEGMDAHRIALCGVFCARIAHDRKGADALLKQIAISSGVGKLDFDGGKELLSKHYNTKAVREVLSRHAYELTVMASLISLARTGGVLATSDFLWLKPVDRPLWFMLNSVGRQTPCVEVAGPFAHWKAELDVRRRLYVPMIEEATKALDVAVKEIIYKPDENEDEEQAQSAS